MRERIERVVEAIEDRIIDLLDWIGDVIERVMHRWEAAPVIREDWEVELDAELTRGAQWARELLATPMVLIDEAHHVGLAEQMAGRTLRPTALDTATADVMDTFTAEADATLNVLGPPPEREPIRAREPAHPDGPDFAWLTGGVGNGGPTHAGEYRGDESYAGPYLQSYDPPEGVTPPPGPGTSYLEHLVDNLYTEQRVNPYTHQYAAYRGILGLWDHPEIERGPAMPRWREVAPVRTAAPTTMLTRLHAIVGAGSPLVFRQSGAISTDTQLAWRHLPELQAFVLAAARTGYRQLVLLDENQECRIRVTAGLHEDGLGAHRSILLPYERINERHLEMYPEVPEVVAPTPEAAPAPAAPVQYGVYEDGRPAELHMSQAMARLTTGRAEGGRAGRSELTLQSLLTRRSNVNLMSSAEFQRWIARAGYLSDEALRIRPQGQLRVEDVGGRGEE